MGYEGIFNALAVELDTYFNYDQLDFFENHVSVMTQVSLNISHRIQFIYTRLELLFVFLYIIGISIQLICESFTILSNYNSHT